jgi:hypothetical protein
MNKLFISSIGNCAIFTFFSEIFPPQYDYYFDQYFDFRNYLIKKLLFSHSNFIFI